MLLARGENRSNRATYSKICLSEQNLNIFREQNENKPNDNSLIIKVTNSCMFTFSGMLIDKKGTPN